MKRTLVVYEMVIATMFAHMLSVLVDIQGQDLFGEGMIILHLCAGILLVNLIGNVYENAVRTLRKKKNRIRIRVSTYFSVVIPYSIVYAFMFFMCQTIRGFYVSVSEMRFMGVMLCIMHLTVEHLLLRRICKKDSDRYYIFNLIIAFPETKNDTIMI